MKILLVSHEPTQYEEKLLNFKKKFIGLVISNTNSTDEFTKTIQKDEKYNFTHNVYSSLEFKGCINDVILLYWPVLL